MVQADVMSWSSSGASRKAALIKRGWQRHESAEVKQAESFPWSIRNWDIDFSHYWFPTNARKVYSLHIFTYVVGSLWPLVYFNLTFIINYHFVSEIFVHFAGIRSWDTNLMDCNLDQELKLFVSRHSARFSADAKGKPEQATFVEVSTNFKAVSTWKLFSAPLCSRILLWSGCIMQRFESCLQCCSITTEMPFFTIWSS